jgi:DNA polymerase-3 subunit delta
VKAKDAQISFESFQKQYRAKEFGRLYLFYGEEQYLCKFYVGNLLKALGGEVGDMNTNLFEGKNATIGQIIDQAETLPLFAENRIIYLRDTGLVKGGSDELAEYLENPCESSIFIFWEKDVDERSKLFQTIKKQGTVVCIQPQDRAYLKKNIGSLLRNEGKRISDATANHLLDKTGSDMANLRSELDKLIAYCMDKEEITGEDVDAICSQTIEDKIFVMIDFILEGRRKEAMALYYDLLALKVPPVKVLVLIERRYMQLLKVKSLREQGEVAATIIPKMSGMFPSQVQTLIRHAGQMTRKEIQNGLNLCVDIDEGFKSGRIDEAIGTEMVILNLLDRTMA